MHQTLMKKGKKRKKEELEPVVQPREQGGTAAAPSPVVAFFRQSNRARKKIMRAKIYLATPVKRN